MPFNLIYLGRRQFLSLIDNVMVNDDFSYVVEQAGDIQSFHIIFLPSEFAGNCYGITRNPIRMILGVIILCIDGSSKGLNRVMVDPLHTGIESLVLRRFFGKLQE